jgi:tRNA threonylcarbamoyladenosine biosynthesis protein TsaB
MQFTPITLAIELSGTQGTIALMNNKGDIVQSPAVGGNKKEDDIFPFIESTSKSLGIQAKEVDLLVVSIGPGGFTGLRTAIATAKMIALVSGAAIVPVETAIVAVEQAARDKGTYLVITSVKGDSFWLSKVQKQNETWSCDGVEANVSLLQPLLAEADGVFADDFLPSAVRRTIEAASVPICSSFTDAKSLLRVGLCLFQDGKTTIPEELLPLYPRVPEAVRLWNSRHKTK